MSGPIVRKYGFPNFEKIFGAREIQHGVDEPRSPDEPAAKDDARKDQPADSDEPKDTPARPDR